MRTLTARTVLTLLPLTLVGCPSDPIAPDASSADTPLDAGGDLVDVPFRLLGFAGTLAEGVPLDGFEILVDQPDGTRLVGTTGADGRALVRAVSLRAPISITFWGPGYVPVSIANVVADDLARWRVDGDVLEVLGPAGAASVQGTARNMEDPAHALLVSGRYGPGPVRVAGPAYTVPVRPGLPLELVAIELVPAPIGSGRLPQPVRWGYAIGPAPSDVLDVDLTGGALVPRAFSGTLERPAFLGTAAQADVTVLVDGALVGLTASGAVEGATVTFAGEYVELPSGPRSEVLTQAAIFDGSGRFSAVLREGYPDEPLVVAEFPPLPRLAAAPDPRTLADPIDLEAGEPGLVLVSAVGGPEGTRWLAYSAREGGSSLTLPPLPPAALAQLTAGGEPLTMTIYLCESELPERQRYCRRVACLAPVGLAIAR